MSRRTRRRRGAVCPGADVECMVVRLSAGDHVGATDRAAAGRGFGIPVLGGGSRSRQRGAFPVPAAASWARDSGDRFHTGESQRLSRPGGQGAEVAERAGAAMPSDPAVATANRAGGEWRCEKQSGLTHLHVNRVSGSHAHFTLRSVAGLEWACPLRSWDNLP